jgi:8-oxo-dGTP pyrophosphatase MutT (NUDIX family)
VSAVVAAGQRQAVVAVLVRDGKVLVIRRWPEAGRPGWWTPPSGSVEPGEPRAEAVVREVREELGLTARPLAEVWECDTDDGAFRLFWWLAEVAGGALVPDPAEVSEARWIAPAEFGRLAPAFDDDVRFFAQVLPPLLRTGG